jgi:hypothetical protein
VFDNIKGKFGGSAIENALTASRFAGRILGMSKAVEIAVTWGWMATGNNAVLTTDMIGRTVHSRIETLVENPGARTGFRYPNLIQHIFANRRELVMAALSIPAHFIRAGRPNQGLPAWGGFENWSDLVRQSIVWAGQPDCDSRVVLAKESDTERDLLALFIEGWPSKACRVGDAVKDLGKSAEDHPLRLAVNELCGAYTDPRKIGTYLRDNKRKVVNGRYFNHTDDTKPKWFVSAVAA